MPTAVVGLFDTYDTAQMVVNELLKKGCKKGDIEILGASDENDAPDENEIVADLKDRGFEESRARRYGKAVQRGVALVAADTTEEIAQHALGIMQKFHAMSPEDVLEAEEEGSEEAERRSAMEIEEDVEIGKRETTTGGKKLVSEVTERPVEKTIPLKEERVTAKRRDADRELKGDEAEKAFKEEDIEMKETSERPTVSKSARVTGEVELTKESSQTEGKVHETARRKDVRIEDSPAGKGKGKG